MRWLFQAHKTTKKWPEGRCAPFRPPFCWENLKTAHGKDPEIGISVLSGANFSERSFFTVFCSFVLVRA